MITPGIILHSPSRFSSSSVNPPIALINPFRSSASITTWTFIDLGSSSFALPAVWYEGIFHNGYHKVLIVLSRSVLCWSMCFAFIGLTHRYLSQPRKSIRYLADSAYWVYWVHLPITFKLSYMAQSVEGLNALTKSYLVLVLQQLTYIRELSLVRTLYVVGRLFHGLPEVQDRP